MESKSKGKKGGALPEALVQRQKFNKFVQEEMKMKGGPILISFANKFLVQAKAKHPTASPAELNKYATEFFHAEKDLKGLLEKTQKDLTAKMAANKEVRHAAKAAAKTQAREAKKAAKSKSKSKSTGKKTKSSKK